MTQPNYYFTSDNHFFHRNIIEYCNRPFDDVETMNATMVERWNDTVRPHDIIYHIGDVIFNKDREAVIKFLRKLHGQKHVVWGNHDRSLRKEIIQAGWHDCGELHSLNIPPDANNGEGQHIILCHYAMRVWDKSHYGSWQLYGHSHGSLPDDPNTRSCDVGVDNWNFTPVSMEQLNVHMSKKLWKPIDHHGA